MSPVPFLVAYDFETLCTPVEEEEEEGKKKGGNEGGKKTQRTNVHIPFCYGVVVVDSQGNLLREPIVYSDSDPEKLIHHFLDTIFDIEQECFSKRPNYPINMTEQQEKDFKNADTCWICQKGFTDPEDLKVHDHSPLLEHSNLMGAAHRSCNSFRSKALFLPAICHNSAKFDLHMIMKYASTHEKFRSCDINILPRNMEVYRTMTLVIEKKAKREIRFLDSYQHFSTNLSDLLESLTDDNWFLLRQVFPEEEKQSLLKQKGVMCYDFLTTFERVKNQKELPEREAFYNRLKQEAVSEEDYQRAEKVWNVFECDSLLTYTELYCLTDVIGLMAFYLEYRKVTALAFNYEVSHFVSTPSLSLACAIKKSNCQIPLITCPDTFLKFEKSIRGGLSGAVLRHAKANNRFTPDFNKEEEISHILYADVNALYSYCLAGSIPAGEFTRLCAEECAALDLRELHESSYAALLEVDLAYGILPGETSHHEDWPLAPTHICPDPAWFSEYQKRVADATGFNQAQKTRKLMSVIGPRKNYLIHSTLLEFYLEKGMEVTRFHGGIKYRTEEWLKSYIDFLMNQRREATTSFMSSYWKLMANSLYGSFLRRPRADRTIKICQTEEEFLKLTSKASYKGFRIFSKDMCAVESLKKVVNLCQPIFVASAILDYSKLHITKLFWEMKTHFSSQKDKKMEVIAFDTDSILCKVTTPELDKDLKELSYMFDFSSLPKWHPLYDTSRDRVPGYLKIELGKQTITEMVAIKSKCYAINYIPLPTENPDIVHPASMPGPSSAPGIEQDLQIMRRCKGIPASALNKHTAFSDYKKCVFEGLTNEISFCAIKSDGEHNVYTVNQKKRCLSAFENKRKILADGIKTLPYCVGLDGCEMPWPEERDPGAENLKGLVELMDLEEEKDEDEGACNLRELIALMDSEMYD
ncbi:hypothetical protein FOCC_FOCC008972 [Frankliniella occidentalis]|uniref:DNA-directed DNA polymerase n=1 Tax=Frankliniella occidentalis TaxID=133901 RepID=A0A6J1SYZ3_FRAOC|nr:uncharacterized protein LOC113210673 [Frankliniella occidentalis]KAE8744368.1 hypothetical protein FOCC_FOCC008972 [Frankliniella occidentalis]